MAYEHTQTSWPMRIAFGLGALALILMTVFPELSAGESRAGLWVGAIVAALLGLLWTRMTIRIENGQVRWYFGFGWPRFKLPLVEIANVDVTHTTFWQGWGIRRTRIGWLYNIAGFDAVRITRRDGREFLLGTDEPRRLKAAIERSVAASGTRV